MERTNQSYNRQLELEQRIDSQVEQLQYIIDDTIQTLSNAEMPDTDREGAMIDLRSIIDHEIEALNELDPSLGQKVRVSGNIERAYHNEFEERDSVESVQVQSETMESAGFVVWPVNLGDGEERQTVGHLFHNNLPARVSTTNGLIHHATAYYSFAPYRSVTIERPWTENEILSRLETTAPNELYELESRLLNVESTEQALKVLGELSYSEDSLDDTTRACFVAYANQILSLSELPLLKMDIANQYRRTVIGIPMTLSLKQNTASVAARVDEATLYQDAEDESGLYHWALRANIQAADVDNQNLVDCPDFALPAKNIINISQLSLDN